MEQIRRVLREVLGWDSWAYRRGSELLGLMSLLRSEGLGTARALNRLGKAAPGVAAEELRFSRLLHPFHIRPGTKDVSVALNNFVREEYGALGDLKNPRVLVDGGAYIGDTSAYFLSRFPELRSIALEPMADSLAQARVNLAPYGDRVELREAALTVDGAMVRMSGEQTGARIGDTGNIEVPSQSIPQILDSLPEGRIDILKMDIEGAEGMIFAQSPETWLERVGMIIVETHGPQITDTVLGALKANGWRADRVRNLYFCRKA
jgi:FkbM family methyltransferase